jgi:hypothetical protein
LESKQIPEANRGKLMKLLLGCPHEAETIRGMLNAWNYPDISQENVIAEFVNSFF